MNFSTELLKGSVRPLILSLLVGGEMYGHQIITEMRKRSFGNFALSEGSLYPALHDLERQHLISSRWDRTRSSHPRKYYVLTTRGRQILSVQIKEWNVFCSAANALYSNFN